MNAKFEKWLSGRPQIIQNMAKSHPPDQEYRIKSTGQTAILYSYSEDGTVTVDITSPVFEEMFGHGRRVFGIDICDLEPLPVQDTTDG